MCESRGSRVRIASGALMKRLSKRDYDYIFSRVPRICAELVVKNNQGIALTKRAIEPWKGFWHLPGGTIYFGESVENAVKRIAKQELGIAVKIEKLLGYIEYPHEVRRGKRNHSITFDFLVKPLSKNLKTDDQATEAKFFKKLPKKTVPPQARFLREKNLLK
jgi:ADP-ribose pyrophosphatase YjhB (NUDIX family)